MDAIDKDINLSFAIARLELRRARRSHLMAAVQEPQSVKNRQLRVTRTNSALPNFLLPEHFELVDGEQSQVTK